MEYEFKSLTVYRQAYRLAMEVHELSKSFPSEEAQSLTYALRRSARLLVACIVTGFARPGRADFFSAHLVEADSKCAETLMWLNFSSDCQYISVHSYNRLKTAYEEVGVALGKMCVPNDLLPI